MSLYALFSDGKLITDRPPGGGIFVEERIIQTNPSFEVDVICSSICSPECKNFSENPGCVLEQIALSFNLIFERVQGL